MRRLLLACVLLLGVVVVADAQSAQISSFRLEYGVSRNNQSGVLVRFKLNVNGYRGKTMSAIAYIDSPKGVGVKDKNGKYCTTSGTVAFSVDFTPPYENSAYDNFQIFMPYNEMHLLEGKRDYFCRVFIFEKGGGWITHSDYVGFVGTGSAPSQCAKYAHLLPNAGTMPNENQHIYYTNKSGGLASVRIYYGKDVKEYCAYLYFKSSNQARGEIRYFTKQYFDSSGNYWAFKEYMQWLTHRQGKSSTLYIAEDWTYVKIGNTIFDIPISKERFDQLVPKVSGGSGGGGYNNNGNSNGNGNNSGYNHQSGPSHIDKPCGYCGGGGGCRSCNGRGYKYNPYSGHDDRCPSCNGSGRCFNCRGTGKQATY